MTIYFLLFGVVWIGYWLYGKRSKKKYLLLVSILVFLLMSLRAFSVGTDIQNYISMYKNNDSPSLFDSVKYIFYPRYLMSDPLYNAYCVVLNAFGISERGYLVVTNFILVASIYKFLLRYSNNYRIALFTFLTIGLFPTFMSAIRQSLAIAVILYAYQYLFEKKAMKYYVCVWIAVLFHWSALIMLPAYPIVRLLQKRKKTEVLLLGGVGGIILSILLPTILSVLAVSGKIAQYTSGEIYRSNPIMVIMYVAIGIIYIWISNMSKQDKESKDYVMRGHFIMYVIGLALLIASLSNTIISRFAFYYLACVPVMLSNSLEKLSDSKIRMQYEMLCCAVEVIFFMYTVPGSTYGIAEYLFLWSE